MEYKTTLSFDIDEPEYEEEVDYDDDDDDETFEIPMKSRREAVEYWMSGKKGKLKWETVSARYRFITNERQLYRFKHQMENYGTRKSKLQQIWNYTLTKFKDALEKKLVVHENDLRRWALKEALNLHYSDFKASKWWIWKFKSLNRICSRKITKFVTSNYSKEAENILESANTFLETSKAILPNFRPDHIFNTDQSGFNYEMTSSRTLSFVGEKATTASVSSLHATTHSYTIQPIITLEGKLLSSLFICLQESGGKFGPRVQQNMFQCPNVVVYCSKSGKMTKELVREWCEESLIPAISSKSLLLLDSWSGHSDTENICSLFSQDKPCEILKIPPKTTSLIQPLDVYFFRQWKLFARKIYERVSLDRLEINLKDRNNIIKMHSLIHNQLSSPRFYTMIKYSWFKSGYFTENPGKFKNVIETCFKFTEQVCYQDCSQCSEGVFIICSWCSLPLCFTHFYEKYHYCSNHQN